MGFPWVYKKFKVESNFNKIINLEFEKVSQSHFKIEEDFGYLIYNNKTY